MTSFDLLTTRNEGPLSSSFLVHWTSIIRDLPCASQGFANVPSPLDPSGQSVRGAALATGVGAGVGAGAGGCLAAVGFAVGVSVFGFSCSQAQSSTEAASSTFNVRV